MTKEQIQKMVQDYFQAHIQALVKEEIAKHEDEILELLAAAKPRRRGVLSGIFGKGKDDGN